MPDLRRAGARPAIAPAPAPGAASPGAAPPGTPHPNAPAPHTSRADGFEVAHPSPSVVHATGPVTGTGERDGGRASAGIERVFEKSVGKAQMAALKSALSTRPVVLIAGDQLTGKSTAARSVAQALGGEASGTGRLMRAAAEKAGQPIEEFVKSVRADFDVELDWQATKKIAKGEVAVFESRLAGHLGQMLARMGRENVVSVYLVASPRERALRYLARELSPDVRTRVEARLSLPANATLEECMQAIVALNDPDANQIASQWKDIAQRDDVDKARLLDLYGVDYQDRSAFDVVVSTDGRDPADVRREILAAVQARTAPRSGAGRDG